MTESNEAILRAQTLQPKFRWRVAGLFLGIILFLAAVGFFQRGVYRAYYSGLSGLAAIALVIRYGRERRLVYNRLAATAIVTDYSVPLRTHSKIANFILSKLSPDVSRIKYSFVALDQRTYGGETGWGAARLYKGARIIVVYHPEKPDSNHPLGSFVFFSFH